MHSQSAIGEQFVALLPRDGTSTPLKNGDVIARKDTSVPPAIDSLLDAANRGLLAIPHDNLKTAIDESYTAIGGLGPELSRIVKGSSQIAIDARANLNSLTTLIDQFYTEPVTSLQPRFGDGMPPEMAASADLSNAIISMVDEMLENERAVLQNRLRPLGYRLSRHEHNQPHTLKRPFCCPRL